MTQCEVWIVGLDLPAGGLSRCAGLLDAGERARAARFVRPADRDRYAASHAALRLIFGRALGRDPAGLRFAAGPAGKPDLAGPGRAEIAFNLSHSGAHALVGIARGAPVGVDVEVHRPLPDALRIARAHFAPDEAAALGALPAGAVEPAFFGLWTRKEAVAKALGAGLSLPLGGFSLTLPPAPPRLLRGGGPGAWSLADVPVGPDAAATVAVRADAAAITVHRLAAGWPDGIA